MKPRLHFPNFTINIAAKPKVKRTSAYKISRRCYAVIIIENGNVKARVSLLNDISNPDYLLLPLTKNSFDLKGKEYVFTIKKYNHNKPILIIRSYEDSIFKPGSKTQYTPFKHNSLVAGKVIKTDNGMLFDYETLVAVNENGTHINPVKVDTSKPLFDK